ncbi:MAG: hypothetical protein IPF98_08345 [Gemmatimonadetes bacterium]|nr:hypothetical protein [Gemmatimonadota bacterium]
MAWLGTRPRAVWVAATAALTLGAVLVVVARGPVPRREPVVAQEFALGSQWADSVERVLARQSPRDMDPGAVMSALYLERLRLGVGSPFRLVDYVLRDPLIPEPSRRMLAAAILARTQAGAAYATPPEAMSLLAVRSMDEAGLAHRQFMEAVAEESESPRVAELALRLAYTVGTASGSVSHRAPAVALAAIAQSRDRALAMRDVDALVDEARSQRLEPIELVPLWRASRRFAVERPLVDPPLPDDEAAAVRLLPALVARLDSLAESPESRFAPRPASVRRLGGAAGALAAELVARRAAPPQAPVTVTMGGYAAFVVNAQGSSALRRARSLFVARARTEESLVAELARLRGEPGGATGEPALALLTASVAMRAYAQERAWLPGDDGPPALELQSRLGLASLTFDDRVPNNWRPYFTRMLGEVVSDLTMVFPELNLQGLNVRFGDSPLADRALALHDPGTRTVYFPLATSAGAMAHELAHDLDWQAARRRYGLRGGYRTDRSVRQFSDEFSATVRRLASAARPRSETLSSAVQADRPTEAFARGVDWFVAAALARQGRMNGYLSSVQDAVITGYASATPPRSGVLESDATLDALREIAVIDPSTHAWYASAFGRERRFGVADGVRRALIAPLSRLNVRSASTGGFDAIADGVLLLRSPTDSAMGWSCLLQSPSMRGRDERALRDGMYLAAEARARGLVRRWGDYSSGLPGGAARFRALAGAPWRPAIRDSVVQEVRDAILWRAARPDDGRVGLDFAERAERRAAWEQCARGN